jgi:hypothetical protein
MWWRTNRRYAWELDLFPNNLLMCMMPFVPNAVFDPVPRFIPRYISADWTGDINSQPQHSTPPGSKPTVDCGEKRDDIVTAADSLYTSCRKHGVRPPYVYRILQFTLTTHRK